MAKKKPRIFISGPMTGYAKYNFPKFDLWEKKLAKMGWDPVNPARISRRYKAVDIENNRHVFERMIEEQLVELRRCQAILLFNGWWASVGAKRELAVALAMNLEIIPEDSYT